MKKHCYRCHQQFPRTNFYRAPLNTDGLGSYCKPCTTIMGRQWKQKYAKLRPCQICQQPFRSTNPFSRLCSKICKRAWWHQRPAKSYARVIVTLPNGQIKTFQAHRILIEQKIQRPLQLGEVVHHKNGNKRDNRLENLELTNWTHHSQHHAHGRTMKGFRGFLTASGVPKPS